MLLIISYIFVCMEVGVAGTRDSGVTGSLLAICGASIPKRDIMKAFC